MYCPRCASRMRVDRQGTYCDQTKAYFSDVLREGIVAACVLHTDTEAAQLRFVVGGVWYCPGCASRLVERDGRLCCPACGACLNRFVHQLVEIFVHPAVTDPPLGDDSPLLRASVLGQTEVARAIATHSPDMLTIRGAGGESPEQLALAANHVGTAVALLRASRHVPLDSQALLEALMEELSEQVACAGWLDSLEHYLWYVIQSKQPLPTGVDPWGFGRILPTVRDDLRWLSELTHGWFHYPNAEPEFISLDDWIPIHAQWVERWPTSH